MGRDLRTQGCLPIAVLLAWLQDAEVGPYLSLCGCCVRVPGREGGHRRSWGGPLS